MNQSLLTSPQRKNKKSAIGKRREAAFWDQLKKQIAKLRPNWLTERIESWATPGFPDVFLEDDRGVYHTIELKHCITPHVDLSPHQVSFHSRHKKGSSWILVKYSPHGAGRAYALMLYHGSQAVDVRMEGLSTNPVLELDSPASWEPLFQRIEAGHVFD